MHNILPTGTKFDSSSNGLGSLTSTPENTLKARSTVTDARIIKLLDDLRLALDVCDDRSRIVRRVPQEVLDSVVGWLKEGQQEAFKVSRRCVFCIFFRWLHKTHCFISLIDTH